MIKKQVTRLFFWGGGGLQNEGLKMQNENMKLTIEEKQAAYKLTLQNPTGEAQPSTKCTKSELNKWNA